MGRDKALVEVAGTAMARRVADALDAAGATAVSAVGGDPEAITALGLQHVPDEWPGEGPLGGLLTALRNVDEDIVAVLACDLVAPDPASVQATLDVRCARDADVAVPVVDGRHQWLHSCWHRRVEGIIADVFRAGERSIVGATLGLDLVMVENVPSLAVADADTPEDLPRPDA